MKKVLILTYTANDEVLNGLENGRIKIKRMFALGRHTTKIFRLFPFLKNSYILRVFCDKWIGEIKKGEYETVIISAESIAPYIVKMLNDINAQIRVIVYYWNCCAVEESPQNFDKSICELWTFDKNDAEKFRMNYNPQFFAVDLRSILKSDSNKKLCKEWDIYFIGRDKGRKQTILELEKTFNKMHYCTKFLIMKGQTGEQKNKCVDNEEDYDKDISYNDNIENVIKSKALLEICVEGQAGLTIRTMEALYLKKKLITNNKSIRDTLFYNRDNVFILEEDQLDKFDAFMKLPWKEQSEEVLEYYTGKEWLKRFGIEP